MAGEAPSAPSRATRLSRAVRSEITKASRRPALLACIVLLVLAAGLVGPLGYSSERERMSQAAPTTVTHTFGADSAAATAPEDQAERGVNGFYVLSASGRAGLMLAAILLLTFSAVQISGEATGGTLRLLLTRPISRTDLLIGRAATLFLACILLVAIVAVTGWTAGLVTGGYGDILDAEYGTVDYTTGQLTRVSLLVLAAAPLALFAVACFGLFLSVLVDSAATAVTLAVLLGMVGFFLDVVLIGQASTLNFLSWVNRPIGVLLSLSLGHSDFGLRLDWLIPAFAVPIGTSLVFLSVAGFLFRRRDIHS
jgi:ABC-type transport system involved in multi-copper enzyme maturation permease subunit